MLGTEIIRFKNEIVGSLNAYHLHVSLAFRREGADFEISEHKVLITTERAKQPVRCDWVFRVIRDGRGSDAEYSVRTHFPDAQVRSAIGDERPTVNPKTLPDYFGITLTVEFAALSSGVLLCSRGTARCQQDSHQCYCALHEKEFTPTLKSLRVAKSWLSQMMVEGAATTFHGSSSSMRLMG